MIISSAVSANFFPRHLYPLSTPLALLSGVLFYIFKTPHGKALIFLPLSLIIINMFRLDFKLATDPLHAPLAQEDVQQYFHFNSSGVGLREIAKKIEDLSIDDNTIVVIDDNPFLVWSLPNLYGTGKAQIYSFIDLEIKKIDINRLNYMFPTKSIYLVTNKGFINPTTLPIHLFYSYPRTNEHSINIYKFNNI